MNAARGRGAAVRSPHTATGIAARLTSSRSPAARAAIERLAVLAAALTGSPAPSTPAAAVAAVADGLAGADRSTAWLTLAVLRAELPEDDEVVATARAVALDGPLPTLAALLRPRLRLPGRDHEVRQVEVVTGQVLVDVEHTAHTALATGIQRVARQATARWAEQHDLVLVGWTRDQRALRRLTPAEEHVALHGTDTEPTRGPDTSVVVPWHSTYLLPELATERPRTMRMLSVARRSRSHTAAIGFDCVPLSTAETVGEGMGAGFAGNLAALRHVDRVVTISDAAATEYRGWRQMLAGTGLPGPHVVAVALPVESDEPVDVAPQDWPAELGVGARPLVLCVGSHEPRKNHLAVLEAAERTWRAGLDFGLLFVGGHSWRAEEFGWRLDQLRAAGRPVATRAKVSEALLWASYREARCVMFPSLNEGFGLPVAESLSVGTPVITSDFGSMRELARHGGALLVDPRDDEALTDALASVLSDDTLHARLRSEALAVPRRSWDTYAAQAWDALLATD